MLDINDSRLRLALNDAGKWSRRVAILIFVFIGLFALFFLLFFSVGSATLLQTAGLAEAGLGVIGFLFFGGILGLYFYLGLKLYKFGKTFDLSGSATLSNERIAEGFQHLGSLYRAFVLITAGMLAVGILGLVFMGLFS